MATFYVVRHGQTLLNVLGRAQGWCDSPLTTEGEDAAAGLGSLLKTVPLHAAYASDTMRAVQTARICLEAAGQEFCPVIEDAPNSLADMNRRLPEVAEAILSHDETNTAESFQSIADRAMEFLQDAVKLHGCESNVLVVTHAFLIKTMLFVIEPERLDALGIINNGSFVKLHIE